MGGTKSGNTLLRAADRNKADEFYTQLVDIELELKHYKEYFKGKVVLCNCDDPYESNFFKYFAINFNYLGLKKLIATCYDGSFIVGEQLDLFEIMDESSDKKEKKAYKIEITEVPDSNNDGAIDLFDVENLLTKSIQVKDGGAISSENFNGTINEDGEITENGSRGWAIDNMGNSVFNNGFFDNIVVGNNAQVRGIIGDTSQQRELSEDIEYFGDDHLLHLNGRCLVFIYKNISGGSSGHISYFTSEDELLGVICYWTTKYQSSFPRLEIRQDCDYCVIWKKNILSLSKIEYSTGLIIEGHTLKAVKTTETNVRLWYTCIQF